MANSFNWEKSIEVEPWGSKGGSNNWIFHENCGISSIKLKYEGIIDSISFSSVSQTGNIKNSDKFGGEGGGREKVISLQWPKEYLTKISGTQNTYEGIECIESLCFETNLEKHGPIGPEKGTRFEFSMKNGVIVGFHGRCGHYLNSIGVFVKNAEDLFGTPEAN